MILLLKLATVSQGSLPSFARSDRLHAKFKEIRRHTLCDLAASPRSIRSDIDRALRDVVDSGSFFRGRQVKAFGESANAGTASTTTTTGALVVAGGAGLTGDVSIGGFADAATSYR